MKKLTLVLMVVALLLQALPAFAQEAQTETNTDGVKKYAVQFSLAGAFGGKNSFFEGEVVSAFKLGVVNGNTDMFTQVGVTANAIGGNWEYGASIGLGGRKESTMIYGFLDALYSHGRPWLQARVLFSFRFGDTVEFSASYGYGLSKAVKLENGLEMRIENSVRANLSVFLFSRLELFGNVRSIGSFGQKRLVFNAGLKIWPVRWASVNLGISGGTVGWMNPGDAQADWGIVSNMLTRGFRIMVNLGRMPIRGSSAQAQSVPVPIHPVSGEITLSRGTPRESEEDTTPRPSTVASEYKRTVPGGYYPKADTYFPDIVLLKGGVTYSATMFTQKLGIDDFGVNLNIETNIIYTVYVVDGAMGGQVGSDIWINDTKLKDLNGYSKFYQKNDGTIVVLDE